MTNALVPLIRMAPAPAAGHSVPIVAVQVAALVTHVVDVVAGPSPRADALPIRRTRGEFRNGTLAEAHSALQTKIACGGIVFSMDDGSQKPMDHIFFQPEMDLLRSVATYHSAAKNPYDLLARLRREFGAASDPERYLADLSALIDAAGGIAEVANSDLIPTVLTFFFDLRDCQHLPHQAIARRALFVHFPSVPVATRNFLLNEWSIQGNFDAICAAFDRDTPCKLARLDRALTPVELEHLTHLGYETAGIKLPEGYFLVRGDTTRVLCPSNSRFLFHTHPFQSPDVALPSRSRCIGQSDDYWYEPHSKEFSAIVSPYGILLYVAGYWTNDSWEPFEQVMLQAIHGGAAVAIGQLHYHAYWADHTRPMLFVSWDAMHTVRPALLPSNKTADTTSNALVNSDTTARDTATMPWAIAHTADTLRHPDSGHRTGSFDLTIIK